MPEPDRETGMELLNSGEFGRVESAYVPARVQKRTSGVAKRLWMRELKPKSVNSLSVGEVKQGFVCVCMCCLQV